jgi:hypothetical protein
MWFCDGRATPARHKARCGTLFIIAPPHYSISKVGDAGLGVPRHSNNTSERRGEFLEDTSAVLVDQRIDQFTPVALENGEGSLLIRAHQPRISDDIGTEDRRQPPLYPFPGQSLAPREEGER